MDSIRNIIVTGGNRGIGNAVIHLLCKSGNSHRVIFTCRNQSEGEKVLKELQETYQSAKLDFHPLELSNTTSIKQFENWYTQQYKSVDILINNAAIGESVDFSDHQNIREISYARRVMDTNILGTINLTESLLPSLTEDGKVIIVSSGLGKLSSQGERVQQLLSNNQVTKQQILEYAEEYVESCKNQNMNGWSIPAYNASKAIINAYVRFVLSKEVTGKQSAIAVCPGWCRTDMGGPSAFKSAEQGASDVLHTVYGIGFDNPQQYNGKFFSEKQFTDF